MEVDESVEKLIHLVSEGEISYTVCDEVFAVANSSYYPDLNMETVVSLEQNLAWAVRKGSDSFVEEINKWMSDFINTSRYKNIYARYFSSSKPSGMVESDYYAINSGKISPYDKYIREYSIIAGWDWRLLTSLIYQESRFRPDAVSWAGAFGIMQFMPATAGQYGISPESSPDEQILAGVKFISWLDNRYKEIEDNNERIKFILAAYNIGPGHIDDARRLAGKNGADPDVWDNSVDSFLLAKSDPVFYNDPVVKHGYCRGTETFQYVSAVMERYSHYKNVVGE